MPKKWYAVYTKPNWEKKVASLLTKKKIENYCPLNCSIRQWADRRKEVMVPLFTSYVFVRVEEGEFVPAKETAGVINFVYWLNKPAVIKDEEIEVVKDFLEEYRSVSIEKTRVSVNDTVRIIKGAFNMYEGEVVGIYNRRIKVALPSLGYNLVAEVKQESIEIIYRPAPAKASELKYGS